MKAFTSLGLVCILYETMLLVLVGVYYPFAFFVQ